MAAATTASTAAGSTSKYDRQLRLWGSNGQRALEEASILVLGSSATATETLKNLVLPGCGKITIVDDAIVGEGDLESNFFVTRESVGRKRGSVVCELLKELNPDIRACLFIDSSSEGYHASHGSDDFKNYDLVIATQMKEESLLAIAAQCWEQRINLIAVRTYGLVGHIRVVAREHCVVEGKPDPAPLRDMRLANPWPELVRYCESISLDNDIGAEAHMHIPYPVILIKYAQSMTQLPARGDAKGRSEFVEGIKRLSLDFQEAEYQREGGQYKVPPRWGNELNFEEAVRFFYTVISKVDVPYEVTEVVEYAAARTAGPDEPFWAVITALGKFIQQEGCLPIDGGIDDMTASTESFITLQQLYSSKAAADLSAILDTLKGQGMKLEASASPYADNVAALARLVCKNARTVQVVRTRSLAEEFAAGNETTCEAISMASMLCDTDPMQLPAIWYLGLRAVDRFERAEGRYPGARAGMDDDELRRDSAQVFDLATEIATEYGASNMIKAEHAQELVRWGACEPHCIAAYMGGVAAQECIKLITRQYVPLNNTFIFNGINGAAGSYTL
eukprot:g4607.t1